MAIMNSARSNCTGAFSRLQEGAYQAEHRRGRWHLLLIVGLLQVAAGVFAMMMPLLATFTAAIFFGAALVVLGIVQLAQGLTERDLPRSGLGILSGLLYLVVGALMVLYPVPGAYTLTLFVGFAFVVDGLFRAGLAIWLRPPPRWVLQMVSGLLGLMIGVALLAGWPVAGVWALGFLLGVNLLIGGSVCCAIAFALRASHGAPRRTRGD